MKKITLIILLSITFISPSLAQWELENKNSLDKNVVKVNLTGLLFKNYGFQYERMLGKKTSIALGYRIQPQSTLPFIDFLESQVDDPESFDVLEKINFGNTAVTPEIRFYLGKKGGPRGFYIAPYARFSKFNVSVPDFEFTYQETIDNQTIEESRTVELKGDIKGITGGVMVGAQWKLGKSVYLDWWIIGGALGSSTGTVNAITALNQEEQDGFREELNTIDSPFLDYSVQVDANGAGLDFTGPFASLRGGLSLGIKF